MGLTTSEDLPSVVGLRPHTRAPLPGNVCSLGDFQVVYLRTLTLGQLGDLQKGHLCSDSGSG
jgi:hypothetical protein